MTTEISNVPVPYWQELSPKYVWLDAQDLPELNRYLPDQWEPTSKTLDRNFFYGILSTLAPNYVSNLIIDCREKRDTRRKPPQVQSHMNDIPRQMISQLLSQPFKSSK